MIAAAAFTTNWRFAARSVGYWAADLGRSPVLHFWSLSVEEQFYVLWPGLIALAAYAARRVRRAPREVIALALVLTVLLSSRCSFRASSPPPSARRHSSLPALEYGSSGSARFSRSFSKAHPRFSLDSGSRRRFLAS